MMKVLITVKTYPNLSTKYDELVCTAGFREDGSWIRIFPVPFRKLSIDASYKKYESLEIIDMEGRRIMPLINIRNQWRVTVDINILSKGMYMAIFRTWQDTFTALKFIKQ